LSMESIGRGLSVLVHSRRVVYLLDALGQDTKWDPAKDMPFGLLALDRSFDEVGDIREVGDFQLFKELGSKLLERGHRYR